MNQSIEKLKLYILLTIFLLQQTLSTLAGDSPVVLLTEKLVKARVGDTLQINCSSTSLYDVEFKEIGQLHDLTIDEQIGWDLERDGNPRLLYCPEGCQNNEASATTPCISILVMDVELSMHGRAFQCRATSKHQDPIIYHSEGMKLIVEKELVALEISPNTTQNRILISSTDLKLSPTVIVKPTSTNKREKEPVGQIPASSNNDVQCVSRGLITAQYCLCLILLASVMTLILFQ